mmetsp:Transcript_52092/g.151369  ORF Transcript_52092/g.151369 Transcript_52092/m.151369 type:complete len:327 (-) Transcript_52092:544-1524(-)
MAVLAPPPPGKNVVLSLEHGLLRIDLSLQERVELAVVHAAVAVQVNVFKELLNLLRVLLLRHAQRLRDLGPGEVAAVVLIEAAEGAIEGRVVLDVHVLLQSCSKELTKVDHTAVVGINGLHHPRDPGRVDAAGLDSLDELRACEKAIAVQVQALEELHELPDVVGLQLVGHRQHGRPPQLVVGVESEEAVHRLITHPVHPHSAAHLQPRVAQRVGHGHALLAVRLHKVAHKVLGGSADLLPVLLPEVVFAIPDPVQGLRVGLAGEGRVAAEQDVGKNSDAPDVTPRVVFPLQDLWRHVVRTAHLRGHGRVLLRKLAGEAKVHQPQS